jgi:hypothetical protein
MKPKADKVLDMCIEEGLAYGWSRAYKHNDAPTAIEIQEAQKTAIMSELWEWFDMGESDEH